MESFMQVVGKRTGHMETSWGDGIASRALSALLYTHTHTDVLHTVSLIE